MDTKIELELFDGLSRTRLREWLQAKLDKQIQVLVLNPNIEQVRSAQGRAQQLQDMIGLIDHAIANRR